MSVLKELSSLVQEGRSRSVLDTPPPGISAFREEDCSIVKDPPRKPIGADQVDIASMWAGSDLNHSWSLSWKGKKAIWVYFLSDSKPGDWRFAYEDQRGGRGASCDTFEEAVQTGLEDWGYITVDVKDLVKIKGYKKAEQQAAEVVNAADAALKTKKAKGTKKVAEARAADPKYVKEPTGLYRNLHTGRVYSTPFNNHPAQSEHDPAYQLAYAKKRLADIESGPFKYPREVARLKAKIAKLEKSKEAAVSEGVSGISVYGSDAASDVAYEVGKAIAKELRRHLSDKGNDYNTSGPMNVALVIGELLQGFDSSEALQALAKEVREKLKKGTGWEHEAGHARMLKNLDKFIAKGM